MTDIPEWKDMTPEQMDFWIEDQRRRIVDAHGFLKGELCGDE